MGFFSNPFHAIRSIVRNPVKAAVTGVKTTVIKPVSKVAAGIGGFLANPAASIRNPAKKVLNVHIRNSSIYKSVGRPIIKIGVAVAIGAASGGVGLAGGAVTFGGLSTAGALAAGGGSILSGGLTSSAFNPVTNVVTPAISGFVAGNLAAGEASSKAGTALNQGQKLALLVDKGQKLKSVVGAVSSIKGKLAAAKELKKQKILLIQERIKTESDLATLAALNAELATLQSTQPALDSQGVVYNKPIKKKGLAVVGLGVGVATGSPTLAVGLGLLGYAVENLKGKGA